MSNIFYSFATNLNPKDMKKTLLSIVLGLLTMVAWGQKRIIFETDMGNDIDDAMALDMLYKYHKSGRIQLMAVMLNKDGMYSPMYIDLMNRWYGLKNIPIGISDPGSMTRDVGNFAKDVVVMKDEKGQPLYKQKVNLSKLPEAYKLHRRLLASAPDHSVTIVSVGFSTNLARLLDSAPDEYSPLSGRDLVAKKVDQLVAMAGNIQDSKYSEFNVHEDIASCKKVFAEWPTVLITSPFELGIKILYPTQSLREDFRWAKHHPMVDGCLSFLKNDPNRPTWDLTAVLYAVDRGHLFSLSPAGRIEVTKEGYTHYKEDPQGNRFYLTTSPAQDADILRYFLDMIPKNPKDFRK